jgi:hypothetical protein
VPCSRLSLRVAVKAASSLLDHSGSVPGQPPHLIGSQVKIAQYLPERPAAIDRVEELLPRLGG